MEREPVLTIKISEKFSNTVGAIVGAAPLVAMFQSADIKITIAAGAAGAVAGLVGATVIHESIAARIGDRNNPKS